jgi:hypothetical protein
METSYERMITVLANVIDPEAHALLFVGDKPILERTLIRERQIVAEYRAGRVLDVLIEEFSNELTVLLKEKRKLSREDQ